jgi:predicted transcriptional regulator of viral defense system
MKKIIYSSDLIRKNSADMGGVLTTADLAILLGISEKSLLPRRIRQLEEAGVLRRFAKGFYICESFDLVSLALRMYPDSYLSLESVLAEHLVINPVPFNKITVVQQRSGRSTTITAFGYAIEKLCLKSDSYFGFTRANGVPKADPEKALLDVFYFYLKGRKTFFDIYSDINLDRLNFEKLKTYLSQYKNPKFRAFVTGVLHEP